MKFPNQLSKDVFHYKSRVPPANNIITKNYQNVLPDRLFTLSLPTLNSVTASTFNQLLCELYENKVKKRDTLVHQLLGKNNQLVYLKLRNSSRNKLRLVYFSGFFIKFKRQTPKNIRQLYKDSKLFFKGFKDHRQALTSHAELQFSSEFDSGNLFAVFKTAANSYELVLQNDINTTGNTRWFNFMVQAKGRLTFKIININPYEQMSLETVCKPQQRQYIKLPTKVQASAYTQQGSKSSYLSLSFDFDFGQTLSKAQFSNFCPYPYTRFQKLVRLFRPLKLDRVNLHVQNLGKTVGGRPLHALLLTSPSRSYKKFILFQARQLPIETQGSFLCQFLIKCLVYRKTEYLQNYNFVFCGMLNPDGTFYGNSFTNLNGKNLQNKWTKFNTKTNQEIAYFSAFYQALDPKSVQLVVDLRGNLSQGSTFVRTHSSLQLLRSLKQYCSLIDVSRTQLVELQTGSFGKYIAQLGHKNFIQIFVQNYLSEQIYETLSQELLQSIITTDFQQESMCLQTAREKPAKPQVQFQVQNEHWIDPKSQNKISHQLRRLIQKKENRQSKHPQVMRSQAILKHNSLKRDLQIPCIFKSTSFKKNQKNDSFAASSLHALDRFTQLNLFCSPEVDSLSKKLKGRQWNQFLTSQSSSRLSRVSQRQLDRAKRKELRVLGY